MYSQAVQDHFHKPRNLGPLLAASHCGRASIPGGGPYVVLWLLIQEDRICNAAYKTYGCPAAVAAASAAVELLQGKTRAFAESLETTVIVDVLGGLPEGKEHCPELVIAALRAALTEGESEHV